jgi:hypothetical protein
MGEANIWQPRTIVEITGDSRQVEQNFLATKDQQLFVLTDFAYKTEVGALEVYVGGLRQTKFKDWVEVSSNSFMLTVPIAEAGTKVSAVGDLAITSAIVAPLTMLGDGVWAAGKIFTGYSQYLVYGGVTYTPKFTTLLPYTIGATPDLNKVTVIDFSDADLVEWKTGKSVGYSLDDLQGFTDDLYAQAGIVDNGLPDSLGASQRVDAIGIISGRTFKTVAEMKASTSLKGGQRVSWQGYYAQSDGGSNWGVVKSGAHVDDGGSIFSIDANTYVEANLIGSPRISVLKFGAVKNPAVGGASDSYPQFKRTLDKCIENGSPFYIPAGFYRSNTPLAFNVNLEVILDGDAYIEFYGSSFLEVAKIAPYPVFFNLKGGTAVRRGVFGTAVDIASGEVATGSGFIQKVDIRNFYAQSCNTGLYIANSRNVKLSRINTIHCDVAVDIVGQVVVSKVGNCDFVAGVGGAVIGLRYIGGNNFEDGVFRIPENGQVYKNRVFGYNVAVDLQNLLFGSVNNNDLDYCGAAGVRIGLTTDVEVRENWVALAPNNSPSSACILITDKAGYSPANDGHELHGNKLRCYDNTGGHGIYVGQFVRKVNISGTNTNTGLTFALLTNPNTQDINIKDNPLGNGAVRIQSDGVHLSGNRLDNCNLTGASNVTFGPNFGAVLTRKTVVVPIAAGATTGELVLSDLPVGGVNLICTPADIGGLSRGNINVRFDGSSTIFVKVDTAFGSAIGVPVLVEAYMP